MTTTAATPAAARAVFRAARLAGSHHTDTAAATAAVNRNGTSSVSARYCSPKLSDVSGAPETWRSHTGST
ncbi:hypothetical protein [Streptomyces sp. NPDC007984]|uniref:hypothetical protein n=1 Tax=Streptomyces sp. NPDC007984 TaxID=3364801 RepID=UPI0036E83A06